MSPVRVRQLVEVWSLYGFFGLLPLTVLASLFALEGRSRRSQVLVGAGGFIPMLAALVALYLAASFVKSRPMGWPDWDLFTYGVYPVNLLAACLLLQLYDSPLVSAMSRTFAVCASIWCAMAHVYLNPMRPEWGSPPARRRAFAYESYLPMSRIPVSEAEARGIRETRPFP